MQDGRDFTVERRIAALVIADPFLIDPDVRPVVGRAHMEERTGVRFGLRLEVSLVPENTFIVKELAEFACSSHRELSTWAQ